MQRNLNNTIEELVKKRDAATKTALMWSIPGFIGSAIGVIKLTIADWRESKKFWDFIKFKNPGRIFKDPVTAVSYVVGLGSLITSLVYAVKGKAYNDAVKQIRADQAAETEVPQGVMQISDMNKQWAADELLKKDDLQARAK